MKCRIVKKPWHSSISGDTFTFHPQVKFLGLWWEQTDYGCLSLEDAKDCVRRMRAPAIPSEIVATFD